MRRARVRTSGRYAAISANAPGAGWGRALTAAYAVMALAAGARSAVQIATEFDAAPLAFALSAVSAAIYLLAAVALRREGRRWWLLGTTACTVELVGVLAIGTWSLLDPARFPAATVWSGFGSGYGCFPLALPLLGLLYQRRRRPKVEAWQTSPST
jgi:cytochrome bd-type quinol oxidase subunit 2